MITISIEIHFTTLYMADLGTRAKPLGEGAQAVKGEGEESASLCGGERYLSVLDRCDAFPMRDVIR
jgi:hypothetical protein